MVFCANGKEKQFLVLNFSFLFLPNFYFLHFRVTRKCHQKKWCVLQMTDEKKTNKFQNQVEKLQEPKRIGNAAQPYVKARKIQVGGKIEKIKSNGNFNNAAIKFFSTQNKTTSMLFFLQPFLIDFSYCYLHRISSNFHPKTFMCWIGSIFLHRSNIVASRRWLCLRA